MAEYQNDIAHAEFVKLKALLASDPHNLLLLRRCANLALELREYDDALIAASAALLAAPGDGDAMFQRASALLGPRHYRSAAECFALLRNHGRSEPAIAMNLALCHYVLREFAPARAILDSMIVAGHVSADVLRLAVSCRHHLGDIEAAIGLADANPQAGSDGHVAEAYALAYLDAARMLEAERFAAVALKSNPDSVDGLTVRGTLALRDMETASAETAFRRVLEFDTDNGRAYIGLGTIALLAQDLPKARDFLERGVKAMPSHVGSWHVLGWTFLVAGDLDSAERIFQVALELDRNFGETHGSIAAVHALRGRVGEARAEIAIAERLDRQGLAARFASAALSGLVGDRTAASRSVRKTVEALIPRVGARAGRILAASIQSGQHTRH